MNQELELLTFHYILRHPELAEKCQGDFFSVGYFKELFRIAKDHVVTYRTAPTAEQMTQLVQVSDLDENTKLLLNANIIASAWQQAETLDSYDQEWLDKNAKSFIKWQVLLAGLRRSLEFVKMNQGEVTVDNCEELVDKARFMLNRETGVEFTDNTAGASLYDPEAHKTKELEKWSTGYPFLDRGSKGGYWAGSLWVFLGAPKAGKSRLLQNLAAESIRKGHNCAYASFELQEEIVTQRMGANLFNIPLNDYDSYANDTELMQKKIKDFIAPEAEIFPQPKGSFIVKSFPTSAVGVPELENWLLAEEERLSASEGKAFKFRNIYVDYINIMKNWRNPNSENTYMKIKQLAEDLRAMAMRNRWCVITVTQVKQSFFNASDVDMTSAAESSALAATVDFMGGIITDVLMRAQHFLMLKTILSRVSPKINERKKFNIEEQYMRLVESNEEIIHDEDLIESMSDKAQVIVQNYRRSTIHQNDAVPPSKQKGASRPAIAQTPTPDFTQGTVSDTMNINPSYDPTPIRPHLGVTEAVLKTTGNGLF